MEPVESHNAQQPTPRDFTRQLAQTLQQRKPGLLGHDLARKTAVMVTLQEDESGVWNVLFERRAATMRRQPNEVSFPGGHAEPGDIDFAATAVRETSEELGVEPGAITVLGPLDVLAAGTGLLVYPFVGVLPKGQRMKPNPEEVDYVFAVPISVLTAQAPEFYDVELKPQFPDNFPYHLIPGGKQYAWRTTTQRQYFYVVGEQVIWGLTARILKHFLNLARC